MVEKPESWVLAVTALITILVKVTNETGCGGVVASSIRNDLAALKPPYVDGPAQVVLEKFLERIEHPEMPSLLH